MSQLEGDEKNKLSCLSKEDLLERIKQLEAHIIQLRNIISKQSNKDTAQHCEHTQRDFDFRRYNFRHVALKLCYLGWDYQGLAVQEDSVATIETELFKALLRTRLIKSRETSNYHRCGRTDKGVSAFSQVISIDLRSNLLEGIGIIVPEGSVAHERKGDCTTEIRYCYILNKVLPSEIRVLAWAPVEPSFSARFDCIQRTYKYIFPKGNLDIEKMQASAKYLVGEHDFRNLCKMDVGNGVVNYKRKISAIDVQPLSDISEEGYQLFELTVHGQAFLWHQIRCLTAVLFLVGQGKESPDIIKHLLDVQDHPCKPQYPMVLETPLVLFDCEYNEVSWQIDEEANRQVLQLLQEQWTKFAVRSTIVRRMLNHLEYCSMTKVTNQSECLLPGNKVRNYKPLLERPRCESLEDRISHYVKRKRITYNIQHNDNCTEQNSDASSNK